MDRMLSAQQIRAARSLLGWSRRELAIVAGISPGTIKAVEQGKTDARLSTLRKLARTFTAHGVEFIMEGARTGVMIKSEQSADRALEGPNPTKRIVVEAADAISSSSAPKGYLWIRPFRALRPKRA
jgi:transcriptional regulator with XRE-family HTH domain